MTERLMMMMLMLMTMQMEYIRNRTYCASQQTDRAYNESPSDSPDMKGFLHKPDAPLQPPTENVASN